MPVRRIIQIEPAVFPRLLGKRLRAVVLREALEPGELTRLVEIDRGKWRAEMSEFPRIGDFLARRQRRIEMSRRKKPRPLRLRHFQVRELLREARAFLLQF